MFAFPSERQFLSTSDASLLEKGRSFRCEKRSDGVALVWIDVPDNVVNTLNPKDEPEFMELFTTIANDDDIKGVILLSAKKDNFIAGADIEVLNDTKAEHLYGISRGSQKCFQMLSDFKKPIVSAIHGSCLGGGLELALATHYRIATTHPKTVMGLPEVKLGLLPGAGGTQRLPALVGLPSALDMVLKGGDVRADKARRIRLVDQTCDPNALLPAALQAVHGLIGKTLVPSRALPFQDWVTTRFGPVRNYVFKKARESVLKSTGGKYPAPLAILDVVKTGLENGVPSGLQAEAKAFARLIPTPESDGLRSLFLGTRVIGKSRFGEPKTREQKVVMLGAGLMGAGIAQVTAQKARFQTVLYDVDDAAVARGMRQIYGSLSERVKRRIDSPMERDRTMARLVPVTPAHPRLAQHLADATLVIEAVPEKLALKHQVLQRIEQLVPATCVIASNTSALPIADVAAGLKDPSRVVGMHYFSPVDKMPLLEIITTDRTSREATATAFAVGKAQGKQNIVVKDKAGFYTTRILAAFMPEVAPLIAEGADPERIDGVLRKWGFPVGPITLMDEVGIDVGAHIGQDLSKHFGARVGPDISLVLLQQMVAKGLLGRKSGKGFFVYPPDQGKAKGKKSINPEIRGVLEVLQKGQTFVTRTDEEIAERMALRMINEAVYCLEEEVLASPVEGDIGAVFGLGFPPFYGGPFRYIDQQGAANVLARLENLERAYGARFKPSEMLRKYAQDNKRFHH